MPRGRKKKVEEEVTESFNDQDEETQEEGFEDPIRDPQTVEDERDKFYKRDPRWIPMSREEARKYTKEKQLVGYDPKKGLGLLKS